MTRIKDKGLELEYMELKKLTPWYKRTDAWIKIFFWILMVALLLSFITLAITRKALA